MLTLNELIKTLKENDKMDSLGKNKTRALELAWRNERPNRCEKCGREGMTTLDHIVPCDIIRQFGIDPEKTFMPENYRILCQPCNHFKGKNLDFADIRTKEILAELLGSI